MAPPKQRRDSLLELEDQLMELNARIDDRDSSIRRRRSSAMTQEDDNNNAKAETGGEGEEEKKNNEEELGGGLFTINSTHSTYSSLADFSEDDDDDDDDCSFASSWRSGVDLDDDDISIATTKSQTLLKLNQTRTSASELLDSEKLKALDEARTFVATIPRPRSNTKLVESALGA